MLNKIMIIGNVGKAPEQVAGYSKIVTFSVATNEYIKNKETNEFKERTEWHNVKCFGYNAEKALKIAKGSKVYIEGKFRSDTYEKDGVKRKAFYILCDKIVHVDKQANSSNQNSWANTSNQSKPASNDMPLSDAEKDFIPWD